MIFGYNIEVNLLIKNHEIECNRAIEIATTAIKEKIKLSNFPKNTKIHRNDWFFGGLKKMKIWIEE